MKTSTAVSVGVLLLLLSTFQLAAFTIEDRVQCTDNLNVRATPSTTGTIVTTEASGSRGIIIDGPQSANGYTWWRISWDNGHAGWSVQPYLTLVTWYSLNIASSNPNNGVYIYVGPDDFLGQADDTTAFLRFFDAGTLVTLIAPITAGGNNFVKWTRNGSDFSFSTTVDFAMSADYTVTAVYSAAPPVTHTLTVSSANPDSGISITANQTDNYGNLGGVTSFTRTFNHNAAVSFNASATAGGNTFQKWRKDGVDLTTSSTAFVTMDANHTITAVYTTPSFTITTGVSPSGAGTASGGGPFTSGQTVTVVATPNPGYPFVNWTDGGNQVSASANYSFTANGNRNLIANFCGGATDLMVDNASFTPVSRSPGQSFTLNFRIRNLGNVWSCPSRARMRLTADAVLTESDAGLLPLDFLFSTLAPGGATNVSIQVVVPASASPGSYFVGVWVDPDRLLNQINRANDVVLSLAKLTLAGTGGPSLQVTPVAQQVGAYDTTASFLVQNAGGGTMSWNASIIGAPWLHFIGGSGGTVPLGGVQLIVLCDANATSTPRTGSITISAPGAIPASQTVSVTQAANFPTMPRVNWFEFSAIPSPQSAMTDFPLTIRAMDVSVTPAQVQTAFHGVMELSELSRGSVTPRFVEFRNGTWSGMVQLNTPSVQTRFLAASPPGTSTRGQSGWFTVQLPGFSVSVTMSVVRENGTPLSGATVRFEQQGGSPQTKLTDATGKAIFQVPGAGHCTATLEMAGLRTEVDRFTLTGQPEVRPVITLRTLGKRPVVLVPGMLGSCNSYELDLPNRSAYPLLPKYRAELGELKILNPNLIRPFNDPVGWEALKSRLSAHYDVYEAPWDWRVPPIGRGEGEVTAWSKYLKPVIDKAIEQSGHSKVDVVAHSTGGLVTRAYIESNYYEDNIGKFALVAVPNEGSANSYYMWFGGDPSREAIYANTSELNYELWNKPRKWKDLTQEGKLSFYRTQIPALEELLPVYFGSLTSDVGESLRSTAGYPGYMENPLYQLNLGDFERYSYNCAIEKVCAEVFYSASETTAYQIQIDRRSVNSQSGIYPHGRPTGENPVLGDKTVIPKSAVLDSRGQPFPLSTASRGGKHIGIIGKLASEIVEFLDKDRTFPATFSPADDPMPLAPSSSNQLVVAIRGRSRLWMIDPVLAGTGISPSTGHYSNDWARSTVTAEASGSTVAREDAPVGLYRGRVKGFAGETLSLAAQFFESNRFVVTNVTWIVGTNDITFDLQLDPALSNALSLLVVAAAPQAVKSFPSNGTCHLSWDQPTGSNIVGYRIYALREEESLFNVLAATTDLSHDTGLPWSQDGGGTNWFFAVVAVTTAGIESPYSDVVPNSQPTVARFIADVVRGPAPLAVTFTNQSQGSVTNWEWDFDGDGTIDSTEPNPTMVYSQAGNYSVSLTVTGSNGRDTRVAAGFVEVTLPLTVGVWGDPAWNRQAQVPAAAQNGVVAISTGTWHTLALKNDGSVVAWGGNFWSQTAVPLAAQSGVMAISAGSIHTVALKNDGTLVAWGYNAQGQVTGIPTVEYPYSTTATPVTLGGQVLSSVTAISAGNQHTVALKNDGRVVAWGQIWDGTNYVSASVPESLSGVTAIAAGFGYTVALKNGGSVVAWGKDYYGQTTVPVAAQSGVAAIAAGWGHIVALKNDGTVVAWGANWAGQATVPQGLSGVTSVACGVSHTLALKVDGTVVAWGGISDGTTNYIPATVPAGLAGAAAISAAQNYSMALVAPSTPAITAQPTSQEVSVWQSASFAVVATGFPLYYQWSKDGVDLPDATSTTFNLPPTQTNQAGNYVVVVSNGAGSVTSAPPAVLTVYGTAAPGTVVAWGIDDPLDNTPTTVPIAAQGGVTAIAVGGSHRVALKSDGTVVAWGANWAGQGSVIRGLNGVIAIAAGESHTLALKSDGTVVAWGENRYGQVTGTSTGPYCPCPATANPISLEGQVLNGVVAIAAGVSHTVALKNDGTVVAWGQLDDGTQTFNVPATVPPNLSGVTAIAVGYSHTVALKNDGTVVAWGENWWGQTNVPEGLSGVTAIAAGLGHTVALKNDGTVVMWGKMYAESGLVAPTVPANLSGVTAIATGDCLTLAMKSDGTVVMWASTDDGAIYLPSYVPASLSGISAIAANGYQFAVIIDAPVALRATSSGNDLILAWPTSAVGFTLQSTFSLSPPVAWIDSPHQAVAIGNRFTVTNVLSGSPQFFRLRKQQ